MDKCNIFLFVRSKGTFTLRVYKVAVPDKYEEDPLIANTYFNYNLTVKKLAIYSELKPAVHSSHSTFACSGGYIYVFGGKQDGLKIENMRPGLFVPDVYRLDITAAASDSNNMDWELCGRMKVGRVHPGVVVHYNKCYIFGGVLKDKPYAEVYDLEPGKSEELPDPARHRLSTKVMLAESNGDPYVVVGSLQRDYLMSYHISTKYWQFFHDCDSALMNSGHPIFVELNGAKIIFTYFKYKLRAYTLPGEEQFQAVIEGMDEGFMDRHIATPSLIHLQENTFCLVYVDGETYSVGGDEGKNVVIHVTRFDVFFEENRGIPKMQARVRGKMNYIIEGNIYYEGAVRSKLEDFDILEWWSRPGGSKFPTLSKIAAQILAVSASTVAVEQTFSRSGKVLDPTRSNLLLETLEAQVSLSDWRRAETKIQRNNQSTAGSTSPK